MIYVVATVMLQPQARERFLAEVARLRPEVLQEAGCIEYTPALDQPSGLSRQIELRTDVVTIVERWQDLAALTRHSSAKHMLSFRQRVADLVVSTSLQVLAPAT
ncbi:MAG: antibiotic biosynthesis monooxygenase [Steroidobacteraceae bacterium]